VTAYKWLLTGGAVVLLTGFALVVIGRWTGTEGLVLAGAALVFSAVLLAAAVAMWWLVAGVARDLWQREVAVPAALISEVSELAGLAGIACPRVSVVAHGARYAHIRSFHGGPRMTVYSGLLEHWTPLERRGALGHELGHIVNGDWLSYRRVFVPAAALTGAGYVVIFALHWLIGVTFIWMGLYTLLPISLWVGLGVATSGRVRFVVLQEIVELWRDAGIGVLAVGMLAGVCCVAAFRRSARRGRGAAGLC
jgi:Zn-dependent protease with chaperone function